MRFILVAIAVLAVAGTLSALQGRMFTRDQQAQAFAFGFTAYVAGLILSALTFWAVQARFR